MRQSDSVIVSAVRSGDESVFRDLYLQRHTGLLEFAFRYVKDTDIAEEIVQDIFLSLWINRESWSPVHSIDAYLFGAVRNRAMNVGRAKDTTSRNQFNVLSIYDHSIETDSAVLDREIDDSIRAAISSLSDRAREAVTLRWIHGMSHLEIATVLNVSEDAARKLIGRAAVQLRELLRHLKS